MFDFVPAKIITHNSVYKSKQKTHSDDFSQCPLIIWFAATAHCCSIDGDDAPLGLCCYLPITGNPSIVPTNSKTTNVNLIIGQSQQKLRVHSNAVNIFRHT